MATIAGGAPAMTTEQLIQNQLGLVAPHLDD
jgi:hypothetical protein